MATVTRAHGHRAIHAATLCDAFQQTVARFPEVVALRTVDGGKSVTWAEYAERASQVAAGLAALGVARGDTVGLMLTNIPEFHWCDTGAMHLGATTFSIYNTSPPEQIEYVLDDADSRVLFTEQAFLERVLAARKNVPTLKHVVVVDGAGGDLTLDELMSSGSTQFDLQSASRLVEPDDVLTLIYTSGTTGPPKGVMLMHKNLMIETRVMLDPLIPEHDGRLRMPSYLPMAHIAERGFSHYHAIPRGSTVTCVPDPREIFEALHGIRPLAFVGVPRVWEKLKSALQASMPHDLSQAIANNEVPDRVASEVRQSIGFGDLQAAFVGGAPTPVDVLEFFFALGVRICEVWGLSETTGVATVNPRGKEKIGTVGVPLPGVEVRCAPDGEILVRGEIIMKGYRNAPEKTTEAIDRDGWLHTGDVGDFDDEGYLRILDRKKELIINSAGKNMSPANIEAQLTAASPLIGQAVCIGDARPYNVALIVLDPIGAAGRDPDAPETVRLVQKGVDAANVRLSRVEQIKKFRILPSEWLPGGDELTPTMKPKRRMIAKKYAREIQELYDAS